MHAFSSVMSYSLHVYKYIFTNRNILLHVIHIYLCGKLHSVHALKSGTDDTVNHIHTTNTPLLHNRD